MPYRTTYTGDRSRPAARRRTAFLRRSIRPESNRKSHSRSALFLVAGALPPRSRHSLAGPHRPAPLAASLIVSGRMRCLSNLRIGTSGWNYPSGKGTWNGIFYPLAAKGRRATGGAKPKFDELAYYAEHFDTVEINTTFYGQPKATVAQTWADRTPAGFDFSLKLYRKLTHADIPGVPRLDLEAIDEYRRGVEPLANAGKIGALRSEERRV